MFYVKQKISEDAGVNIDITDENVFTRCINGTSILCGDCTKMQNK